MTERRAAVNAKLDVSFVLECRDKDGNVLKTIPVTGALEVPLSEEKEAHGLDDQQPR